jgi:tetratricopeptide (TPR) repeat protein
MIGTALYEAGHAEAAEERFRGVLARMPGNAPALLAVCECLLSRSEFDAAVAVAGEVADDSGAAAAAVRSQAFAALAAGDAAAADQALDRVRRVGLPAAEMALLEAWRRTARRDSVPGTLPAAATPLLASFLEALLRIAHVDAFACLVPLLDLVEIPWRERRELLASMYLRRGFLDSAADEWIAVCREAGPDAGALVGLAQTALARGLAEEARTFAEEALLLDPGDARASVLAGIGAAA